MIDFNDERPKKGGLTVTVYNNKIETALSQLKRLVNAEGIPKELKRRKHYEPPSVVKRRKKSEAIMRWRKKEALINEIDLTPSKKRKG